MRPRNPVGRPGKRKITIKITQKPVRMSSGGLVGKGMPCVTKGGKRVYYG